MEGQACHASQGKLLQHLGNLRKKMVQHHELDNLSEFVLHDVCTSPALSISKAAYFVNNPDFNIVRGVAGYHQQESQIADIWNHQKQFIAAMKNSAFHQKVREKLQESFKRGDISEQYFVRKMADYLEFEHPLYHVWDLKHANHGVLIYESAQAQPAAVHQDLHDALYYLSFCPVF